MKRSKSGFLLFLLFFSCSGSIIAIDWPVEERILVGTFGEHRGDHFLGGIEIDGKEQPVHPIEEGEIIFWMEEKRLPFAPPSGLGSFVVIQHDRELRSVYAHLAAGSLDTDSAEVSMQDVVGILGDTGDTCGRRLELRIIDGTFNQVVNPLLLLPPQVDRRSPNIFGLYILQGSNLIDLEEVKVFSPGEGVLLADIRDLGGSGSYREPLAPYRINVFANGEEVSYLTCEAIELKDGKRVLIQSEALSFHEYYYNQWTIRIGSLNLTSGDLTLEIISTDFAGNERVKVLNLKVEG
jgi:hypothetical protein